jgi:putative PIN family toxin of toxin-antitoxin system
MRIMTDTNILVSAILFPNSIAKKVLERILIEHQLALCSYIIDELHQVFERKFRNKIDILEQFLLELSFELIYTPKKIEPSEYPSIRDKNDLPILVSAILSDIDIFITGDEDFHTVDIDKPQIITLKDFDQLQ